MANEEKGMTKTAATGEILKKGNPEADALALLKGLGLAGDDGAGLQRTATGGVTKWVDMIEFQADKTVAAQAPVQGTGKGFAGVLIGKGEMEVDEDEGGEDVTNPDTGEVTRLRYFYSIRLAAPCPVTFKNEAGEKKTATAEAGDVVCIGERFAFKKWRAMVEDGGEYLVVVQPHSRIKIKGGKRTMWTFNVWEKVLRPPMKVKAEIVSHR